MKEVEKKTHTGRTRNNRKKEEKRRKRKRGKRREKFAFSGRSIFPNFVSET